MDKKNQADIIDFLNNTKYQRKTEQDAYVGKSMTNIKGKTTRT